MIQIIFNEWKLLLKVRMLACLTLFFIVGLTLVTWLGVLQNIKQYEQQQLAQKQVREQWDNLEAMNPHGAARFGTYAFKPITPLNAIDEGINAITGNVLRLEGHVQNEIVYSEASQSLSVSKFGKLKPALLLQYIIPLLLVFLSFASISSEKESGRLKLLVLQGASLPKLIFAKTLSIWLFGLLLLVFTLGTQTLFNLQNLQPNSIGRIVMLWLVYVFYYYIISTLAVYFSARLKNNTAALTSILAVWILWTIFLPKIWGNITDKLFPLPSRQEFISAMKEDRSKGVDGHNQSDKNEAIKQKVLAKYKVASVEELPINLDGIVMQEDEEFGNRVWDKHFGKNFAILEKQKSVYQLSGFINPFASLQRASMGFCGSDVMHHLNFLEQAEKYRRDFIKSLNDKHAYGGSKTGDWGWKADNAFFKSIKDFEYKDPTFETALSLNFINILCLVFWVFLATCIVILTSNKIKLV